MKINPELSKMGDRPDKGLSQDYKYASRSVLNSNSKVSARPDLAANLLEILKVTAFNSLLNKRLFTLQLCPKCCFLRKIFGHYPQQGPSQDLSCLSFGQVVS